MVVLTGLGPTAPVATEVRWSCFPDLVRVVAGAVSGPQHGAHVWHEGPIPLAPKEELRRGWPPTGTGLQHLSSVKVTVLVESLVEASPAQVEVAQCSFLTKDLQPVVMSGEVR